MSDLRDRLAYAIREQNVDAALSVLTEGIEIVTPHREGQMVNDYERCRGLWQPTSDRAAVSSLCCKDGCGAYAVVSPALLVELVEAKEGSG